MNITPIVSQNYSIIQEEAALSEVIGKIKTGQTSLLVFKGKSFSGIPDKRKFLKIGLDVSQAKIKHFSQNVPALSGNEDVLAVAGMFDESQVDYFPVEKKGQIVGVVTAMAVLELWLSRPESASLKVKDIELIKPTGIEKDDGIGDAVSMMMNEKVDHLPVMDGSKLFGIMSYQDFMQKYLLSTPQREQGTKFGKMSSTSRAGGSSAKMTSVPVSSISTNRNLLTITPDQSVQKAVQAMKQNKVHDIIVMQGTEFKGLLLTRKIMQRIAADNKQSLSTETDIQFIGLHDTHLSSEMQERIKEIASSESEKVLRHVSGDYKMVLHVKEYAKTSKKHKYSIHVRLEFPGKIISAHADDWDVVKALRISFEHAENEVQKEFHKHEKEERQKRDRRKERF